VAPARPANQIRPPAPGEAHFDRNSIRTKQALAAAKARGVRLSNPKQAKANKHEADRCAKALRPTLVNLRHLPVEKIADELSKRKVATPRGGRWHCRTVARLLDRPQLR
jgi:hypothetical protein